MSNDRNAEFDPGLLHRYLAGQCSQDEAERFERWVAADPEREPRLAEFREAFAIMGELNLGDEAPPFDAARAWERVAPRAGPDRAPLRLVVQPDSARKRVMRRVAMAAGLLLAVGTGSWLAVRDGVLASRTSTPLREISTRLGQRATLYLSDGTRVVLGPATRIRFAAPLEKHSRDVHLDGEALFEVTHRADWPFLVHTAHAITEDLGTTFTVRGYAADSTVTVAVAEGAVEARPVTGVAARNRTLTLQPGDIGTLRADGRTEAKRGVALEPYLAWAEGRLVFKDMPLREVIPTLARWYDLDIRLTDPSAGDWHVTAMFQDDPAREVVQMLAASLGLAATWDTHGPGTIVTLTPLARR